VLSPSEGDSDPYAGASTGGSSGGDASASSAGRGGGGGSATRRGGGTAGGGGGTNAGRGGSGAAATDDDDAGADAAAADTDPPWRPLDAVDRRDNVVPKAQQRFFREVLEEMTSGDRAQCSVLGTLPHPLGT